MQQFLLVAVSLIVSLAVSAQHTFTASIKNKQTGEPLAGTTVSIESLKKNAAADSSGIVLIKDIPPGKYLIKISSIGYIKKEEIFEINSNIEIVIEMEIEHEEEEEVVI